MGAANSQQAAYNASAPKIAGVSDDLIGLSGSLLQRFQDGDPTMGAARGYIEDTLSADPQANPYLDGMIAQSNDSVRNTMQAKMGTRGLTGGSDYYGLIGKALGENELGMRYSDYDGTMGRKAQAAGMASGVVAGDYIPVAAAMESGRTGAMLPLQAALANSAGVGGLLGQYTNNTQTTKQKGGFMDMLGLGLQAASVFCDRRTKENIVPLGSTLGGIPLYSFNYVGESEPRIGPMADEVAMLQPDALGEPVSGYQTVKLKELR